MGGFSGNGQKLSHVRIVSLSFVRWGGLSVGGIDLGRGPEGSGAVRRGQRARRKVVGLQTSSQPLCATFVRAEATQGAQRDARRRQEYATMRWP